METVVMLASSMVLNVDEHAELDQATLRIPRKSTLYEWVVKLDWLNMLYQRHLFNETLRPDSETWWSSQLGATAPHSAASTT